MLENSPRPRKLALKRLYIYETSRQPFLYPAAPVGDAAGKPHTMPNWIIKSAVQRVISWLPHSQYWNGLLQTCITKSTTLTPSMFEDRLRECRRFLNAFRGRNPDVSGFRALEIGTGWYPTIPVGLYLCGASEIWTMDIDPLLSRDRLKVMLRYYDEVERRGVLRQILPARSPERLKTLLDLLPLADTLTPAELLEKINIHVRVRDARDTGLPAGSIDFFFSSGVLEYIPVPILEGILAEARRVASARFVTAHRLNLVDQFSYFDSSITPYNFLKFSPRQWHWANSPLIWQNRLRICDYRRLFREAGLEITNEENISGEAADLAKIKLAPEFKDYPQADLLVLHSFLTARVMSSVPSAGALAPGAGCRP